MSTIYKFFVALLAWAIYACLSIVSGETTTWTLDAFKDGDLKGASGPSWIVIADDLVLTNGEEIVVSRSASEVLRKQAR